MVAAIVVGAKAAVARAAVARAAETVAAGTAVGRLGAQMEEEVRERERVERGRGGAEKVSLAVLRGLVEVVVTVVAVVARALVAVVEGWVGAAMVLAGAETGLEEVVKGRVTVARAWVAPAVVVVASAWVEKETMLDVVRRVRVQVAMAWAAAATRPAVVVTELEVVEMVIEAGVEMVRAVETKVVVQRAVAGTAMWANVAVASSAETVAAEKAVGRLGGQIKEEEVRELGAADRESGLAARMMTARVSAARISAAVAMGLVVVVAVLRILVRAQVRALVAVVMKGQVGAAMVLAVVSMTVVVKGQVGAAMVLAVVSMTVVVKGQVGATMVLAMV